ncbi:MAG: hypothetical protein V7682_07830 [Cycloclasticus sp.]
MKKFTLSLKEQKYNYGAYAWVIFDKESNLAVKVFKKRNSTEHARNVFKSEVKAYEIAMRQDEIRSLVPLFHGEVHIDKLENATETFHRDMAYAMSIEQDMFVKIGVIDSFERTRITELFRKFGINYTKDASVLLNDENEVVKIIDFATEEFELWHQE